MLISTVILLLSCYFLLRIFLRHHFATWTRQGIPQQSNQHFLFGDYAPLFRQQQPQPDFYRSLYHRTKHMPLLGIYMLLKPMLLINDPQLMRDIMVRSFDHFHDHVPDIEQPSDPLSGHLFIQTGERWQKLRTGLAPAFTPTRLRGMFQHQLATALAMRKELARFADRGVVVDMFDMCSRYSSDGIASVIFGVETDAITDPNDEFFRMTQMTFMSNWGNMMRWGVHFLLPEVKKYTGVHLCCEEVEKFMCKLVRETTEYRERNSVVRKDVLQLMLQLRNGGLVAGNDDLWHVDAASPETKQMSMDLMVSILFTFFVAGNETTRSTIVFCLLELCKHPEMQRKLQEEIDRSSLVTYDSVTSMRYLDRCVKETLRMYPPLPYLQRICTKDYPVYGTSTTIRKGTTVLLPIFGLQRDNDFYPDSDRFDPERFSHEESASERPFFSLGDGPRACIAGRMGKLAVKVALVVLLGKFTFTLACKEDGDGSTKFDAKNYTLKPENGVRVLISQRPPCVSIEN